MELNWIDPDVQMPEDTNEEVLVAWINGEVTKEVPRTVQWSNVDLWALWPKHPTREVRGECKTEYCYNSWGGECVAKKTDQIKLGDANIGGCPSYKEVYKRYIHRVFPCKQGC